MSVVERISVEQFLEQEFTAEGRHEYCKGKISETAYASENHELIVGNIVGELGNAMKDKDYKVYPSNRMLGVPNHSRFYYPDAMVVQGKPEFFNYKKKMQATLNPCTIIEVLSDSTEHKDRGEKWHAYRQIPSLQEYILIAQNQVYVEVFRRMEEENAWRNEYEDEIEKAIIIATQTIPLTEIYRDVELESSIS